MTYNTKLTNLGSIKYFDGRFYTKDWSVIFAPETRGAYDKFIQMVSLEEIRLGKALSKKQLINIADKIVSW